MISMSKAYQSFAACKGACMSRAVVLSCLFLLGDIVDAATTNQSSPNSMVLGSSLTPLFQQPLIISATNKFAFGFRNLTNDAAFYVAVWYANLDNTIVWVANRDAPVTTAASLNFTTTGNLVLLQDGSSTVVWQSNTIGLGVGSAQIQDSGNFVLLNTSGHIVWQSFDFPTDTLLPGQQITTASALTSRKSPITYASGYFALDFPGFGAVELKYTSKSGIPYANIRGFPAYWSLGTATNSSPTSRPVAAQFNQSGILTFYNSSSGQKYLASYIPADNGATDAPIRRLALDLDGNLRTYAWNESVNQWIIQWRAFVYVCSTIQGLCGPNGICTSNSNLETACICPSGFDIVDTNDISKGCVSRLSINCNSTQYVMLDNTDFPYNDLFATTVVSVEDCKQSCSTICTCVAAVYALDGSGTCWLKSALVNGYNPSFYDRITFIKVSSTQPSNGALPSNEAAITNWTSMVSLSNATAASTPPVSSPGISAPPSGGRRSFPTTAVVISSVTIAETLCFGIAWWFFLRKKVAKKGQSKHSTLSTCFSQSPVMFSYHELEVATSNFSEKLGSGGFGTVFKGQLDDGRLVAVKRLEGVSQREEQFRAEVTTMTTTHHMHLVSFYGLCAEDDHRLLVYEYVENGSLDTFLFRESVTVEQTRIRTQALDWKTRFNICLGTARAIAYLHEDCLNCIIHCDIKPQNILIDTRFSPKVADFGLACLFSRNHTLQVTTVHGTRGYLAPEWFSNLPITTKADVFSFGMLLLEIVSGRSNFSFSSTALTTNRWCFPVWAFEQMRDENLFEVMDASMLATIDYEQVERVMKVAFWCIQKDIAARPSMGKVVQMLLGNVPILDPPPPPAELLY